MSKILLSINPEHVKNILSGIKKVEYRKVKCTMNVDKIVIYATSPIMQVVGDVEVLSVLVGPPEQIWSATSKNAGITKEFFDSYYVNRNKAVAYKLGKINIYKKPLKLADMGITYAPQSYIYI